MFGGKVLALVCAAAIAMSAGDAFAATKKKTTKKAAEPKVVEPAADPTLPDLIVLPAETELSVGGCNLADPLMTGTIAIKNNSKVRADRLVTEPLSAAYLPESLDIKDEDIVPNSLAGKEILSTDIIAGKDRVKAGRGFKGKRTVYIVVDPYNKIKEGNELNNVLKRELNFSCN